MFDLIDRLQRVISVLTISVHSKDAINVVHDAIKSLESKEQSLADANEQLERQRERYKELEAANSWISGMHDPERNGSYLVWNSVIDGEYYLSVRKFKNGFWDRKGVGVSKWRHIAPPEQA